MLEETRARLYESYATTHAGHGGREAARLTMQNDILPHLSGDVDMDILDIGCGQGLLVSELQRAGYRNAGGIDRSPEQVALARSNGIPNVAEADFRQGIALAAYDAVVATDFLEHLTKDEVLLACDRVIESLRDGGVFVARVPNMISPFGGQYRYGDLTHETSYTPRSLQQLARAAGFSHVRCYPCPPRIHGIASAGRAFVWKLVSGCFKLALAAETGQVRNHLVTQNIVVVMLK